MVHQDFLKPGSWGEEQEVAYQIAGIGQWIGDYKLKREEKKERKRVKKKQRIVRKKEVYREGKRVRLQDIKTKLWNIKGVVIRVREISVLQVKIK